MGASGVVQLQLLDTWTKLYFSTAHIKLSIQKQSIATMQAIHFILQYITHATILMEQLVHYFIALLHTSNHDLSSASLLA